MKIGSLRARGLAVLSALALATLAACGSNHGDGAGGAATTSGGTTTLTWTMWSGGTADKDAWQKAADQVHAENPAITVKLQTTSFDDYFSKIGTQMASGSAPCIVSAQSLRLGALQAGMVPLDQMMADTKLDMSDYVPAAVKNLQADGKQYALPYDNGPILMLYNKDLFAAAGVPEPKSGWSWADFVSTAKALTKDGKFGYSAYPSDMLMFSQILALTGKQPVTTDGKLQLGDPAVQAAAADFAGLVSKDKVSPPLSGNDTQFPYTQFISGRTAMVLDGPWDLLSIKSQSKFNLGAVTVPAGPSGTATLAAGSGFGISATCPDKDAAFKAVVSLTGKKTLTDLASAGRAFPARLSAEQGWYQQAFPGAKEALDAASASSQPFRTTANWAQVSTDLVQYGVPAFNGTAAMADVLAQIQGKYNQ